MALLNMENNLWILCYVILLKFEFIESNHQDGSTSISKRSDNYINVYINQEITTGILEYTSAKSQRDCAVKCSSTALNEQLATVCWSFQFDSSKQQCGFIHAWVAGNVEELNKHNIVLSPQLGSTIYSVQECDMYASVCQQLSVEANSGSNGAGTYNLETNRLWQRAVYMRTSGDKYIHYAHENRVWFLSGTLDTYYFRTKSVTTYTSVKGSCTPFVGWTQGVSLRCIKV